ncbi:MAG: HAD family phosphatase [Chthoniobacterales bacterium]|nr:HAD family phosphatase [Chthoniobacterales bacterium]
MKTQAFVFDIGNVLVHFDHGRATRAMAELGADLGDRAGLESLAARYEIGAVDCAEFLQGLRGILSHTVPDEQIARAWQQIFEPNLPMWDLVEALHAQYPLYLLSNTNCLHHDYLVAEYAIFEKFADGIFSYRAGMAKPQSEIFALAIRQFGLVPSETYYIDDLAANVEAARAAGLRALLYDAAKHGELLSTLQEQGVQCV